MDKKPLILLVDDEKDFLEIFSLKLQSSGYDVVSAMGGEEALNKLKEIKPDLILLDFNMPVMDGVEVLSKIKAMPEYEHTRVVFLTNYGEPLPVTELTQNDKKFAQEMGAKDFIKKSNDLDDIAKSIGEMIAKNHSE